MMPFFKRKVYDSVDRWRFYYQDPGFNITGDNPVVFNEKPAIEDVLDEFLFPISANRLVVNSDKLPKQDFSRAFCIEFGAAIIHQSKRFACSNNKDWLERLVKYYNEAYKKFHKEDVIISNLFDYKHMD